MHVNVKRASLECHEMRLARWLPVDGAIWKEDINNNDNPHFWNYFYFAIFTTPPYPESKKYISFSKFHANKKIGTQNYSAKMLQTTKKNYFIFISNKIDEKKLSQKSCNFSLFHSVYSKSKTKKKRPKLIIISFRDIGDPCTHITSHILHITAFVYE